MRQSPTGNVEEWLGFPARRLAVYGTLAPGKSNHGQLAGLSGKWSQGTVRGTLRPAGWGLTHGFPGLIWNPSGDRVAVQVFDSQDLERHWDRLDAFEGEDYQRLLVPVEQDGSLVVANIYALSEALSLQFGVREIHVWSSSLDLPPESLAPLAATLCDEESDRAERFHFERDRRRFVACRGWLRTLVGRYRRCAPEKIRIAYGPAGKPFVDGGPHFNISHSSGLALLAFCAEEEVGVDLEAIREMPDAEEIAHRCFSPVEIERWMAAPHAVRTAAFFASWTRHESVIKALGLSLSQPATPPVEGWSLFDVMPPAGYAATVAIRGEGWQVRAMGQCSRGRSVSQDRIG
jgi:4'-phosphopantetheinyl transferase